MKLKFHADSHAYYLDGTRISGVTTWAKIPDNTYNLHQWEKRMVAIGVASDRSIAEAVAVNFDDKKKMGDLIDKAKTVAKAFTASDRGTTLHQVTERHDLGLELIDTDTNIKIRAAYQAGLEEAGLTADERYVERIVLYPELKLAGMLDRILYSTKLGALVIGDAKGGKNAIDYPHAIAVQLALYANAPLLAGKLTRYGITETFEPMPDVDKAIGYVIWMPTDDHAEVVPIDIAAGWECFNKVILPTLEWRNRKNLVRPTTPPLADLLEQSCTAPSTPTNGPSTDLPNPSVVPSTGSSGTSSPPTETSTTPASSSSSPPTEADLKARLREIHQHQPDLAHLIGRRWPPGVPAIKEPWTSEQSTKVSGLLLELDIEGPLVDQDEFQKAAYKLEHLTDEQRSRVLQWVQEAASDPNRYRPLSLGAGNHTTRRITLAETCLLIAGNNIDDTTFREFIADTTSNDPVEIPAIGHALGQLNWRQAQHLLTLTRLHLNLHTTIESEPT